MMSSIDLQFPALDALIGTWRKATDPNAAKGVPPHLTLLFPWRASPLKAVDFEQLQSAIAGLPAFEVRFLEIGHFENGTIYLETAESSDLHKLMGCIYQSFPDTPPYRGEFTDPKPHLTIAKAGHDEARIRQLLGEIRRVVSPELPLRCEVSEVAVMEEQADGLWETTRTFALG